MHWFFTGLLIAASGGTVVYTGYLLRRLFTTEPTPEAVAEPHRERARRRIPGTITGPANAAPDSPRRNRPRFEDLPVPDDTANLREGPTCTSSAWGCCRWSVCGAGTGEVVYPTIDGPYAFGQQIVFAHDGRPFLCYEARVVAARRRTARSSARPPGRPGFWRPQADGQLEVLLTHATGHRRDLLRPRARPHARGRSRPTPWCARRRRRTSQASQRLYGLVEGGDLAYVDERAMKGQPMQPHLSARLSRIAG